MHPGDYPSQEWILIKTCLQSSIQSLICCNGVATIHSVNAFKISRSSRIYCSSLGQVVLWGSYCGCWQLAHCCSLAAFNSCNDHPFLGSLMDYITVNAWLSMFKKVIISIKSWLCIKHFAGLFSAHLGTLKQFRQKERILWGLKFILLMPVESENNEIIIAVYTGQRAVGHILYFCGIFFVNC